MHLLATMPGTIADGSAAVDLAQTPGDIVVLSSADTDIALLAAAQQRRRAQDPARPACGSRRSCGSATTSPSTSTWRLSRTRGWSSPGCSAAAPIGPMGSSAWSKPASMHGIPLALVPGDDKPDPELAQLSTLEPEQVHRLWRYLAEGGPANADNLLRYAGSLIGCETAMGGTRGPAAGRAVSGPIARCPASTKSPRSGAETAGSCRSCSTGRSCSRGTPRRSMRSSRLCRPGAFVRCPFSCKA